MKFKLFTFIFLLVLSGAFSSVYAQEEGGDFWSEESDDKKEEESAQKSKPSNTTGVKPIENKCSNREELREEARLMLRPFKYNLSRTSMITFRRFPQIHKVTVPIYNDQIHRLIFSTKGMPQDIKIRIYDKSSLEKKRKLLFTADGSEPINTFELTEDFKGSFLYVEYSIPSTDQTDRSFTRKGCVVLMMGYLFLPEDEGEETISTTGSKKGK